jgi:hypothetical protein
MSSIKGCKHEWWINVSKMAPFVYCNNCAAQFKPMPQQVRYYGVVPEQFKAQS